MGRCFEHTGHADTHVNVQDLMHAIAIRTKTPKNNKGVLACIGVTFGKNNFKKRIKICSTRNRLTKILRASAFE
jgi:hypothetical protein